MSEEPGHNRRYKVNSITGVQQKPVAKGGTVTVYRDPNSGMDIEVYMALSRMYESRRFGKILALGGSLSIYLLFATYLCRPYWSDWPFGQRLLPLALCLGAIGSYLLSRRWVQSVTASFFCGTLYGFGPLTLYMTRFHFTASFIVAAVPWLFCPWAHARRWRSKQVHSLQPRWFSAMLLVVPFILIIGVFKLLTTLHWFILPVQIAPLNIWEWTGLLVPMVMAKHNSIIWGVFHVPLGVLFIGLAMIIKARRWSLLVALMLSFIMVVWHPVLEVCPLIWLIVPVLFMSVCVGIGLQGVLYAGTWDRTWVMGAALLLVILSVFMLLQSVKYFQLWLGLPYARLFVATGKLYILGAVGLLGVYGLIRADVQMLWMRLCFIGVTLATDIVISAGMVIDHIF